MNALSRYLTVERVPAIRASDEDIRQFRKNLAFVQSQKRELFTRLRRLVGRGLSIPLALSYGFRGVRRYGLAIRKKHNISLISQVRSLAIDHFSYRIQPESFYMYQLYLAANRENSGKHFAFSQLLPMQQFLIDCAHCEDFPWLRSKSRFAQRCAQVGLPSVPVLAEFVDGKMLATSQAYKIQLPRKDLFSKPSEYWCGIGATLWSSQIPDGYVNLQSNERHDQLSLIERLCEESRSGSVILQEKVSNHSSMLGSMTEHGLATVRVVTCRTPQNAIDFLPASIRMPVGRAIVDNIAQGGLAAPVDIATGKISGSAIQKDKSLGISMFERHPDTGAVFRGLQLPYWEDVLQLAEQAHKAFPTMPFVGWDIAILQDRPVVLEGNSWWDVDLTILPHRVSLSDTQFIPYYNYHLKRALEKLI